MLLIYLIDEHKSAILNYIIDLWINCLNWEWISRFSFNKKQKLWFIKLTHFKWMNRGHGDVVIILLILDFTIDNTMKLNEIWNEIIVFTVFLGQILNTLLCNISVIY